MAERIDTTASWESLKTKAKGLQGELDGKLQELGRLNKRLGSSGGGVAALDGQIQVVVGLRDELERGLANLADASEALARVAATGPQVAQATRFRETHQDLMRDFKRVAQSIEHQYQHARLIPKGRASADTKDDEEKGLVRERGALQATLSMTDDIIAQATKTHESMKGQRETLTSTHGKVGALVTMFPGISGLVSRISDRKTKEQMVLSSVIAGCVIFTIWYKVS